MADNKKFEKLLAPGQIGKLRIKNRIVKTCGGAEDIGIRNRAFLESMARGGTGLIIWGDVAVEHPRGITIPITQRHLQDDTNLPEMQKIAEAIHKHDCPAFDYAYLHVYFGHDLSQEDATEVIETLNKRWFGTAEGSRQ